MMFILCCILLALQTWDFSVTIHAIKSGKFIEKWLLPEKILSIRPRVFGYVVLYFYKFATVGICYAMMLAVDRWMLSNGGWVIGLIANLFMVMVIIVNAMEIEEFK